MVESTLTISVRILYDEAVLELPLMVGNKEVAPLRIPFGEAFRAMKARDLAKKEERDRGTR